MNDDELEARLRGADVDLGRAASMARAPRVVDLERRHRHQLLRRAAAATLFVGLGATAHWSSTLHRANEEAAPMPLGHLAAHMMDEHLAGLGSAVAELRSLRLEARRPFGMEPTYARGFRALSRGVTEGDEAGKHQIRWMAERLPETHGGRCAHAFLEGVAATSATPPLPLEPRNER